MSVAVSALFQQFRNVNIYLHTVPMVALMTYSVCCLQVYGGSTAPATLDVKEATAALAAHVAERTHGAPGLPGATSSASGPALKSSGSTVGRTGKQTSDASD
jgi:hypothetical protein